MEGSRGLAVLFFGFVLLHILVLRIRDAAFSLLVLCLWGEGFSHCFMNVSVFKIFYSTNFCTVAGRFPYPVES